MTAPKTFLGEFPQVVKVHDRDLGPFAIDDFHQGLLITRYGCRLAVS